jgi:hypothetical protein
MHRLKGVGGTRIGLGFLTEDVYHSTARRLDVDKELLQELSGSAWRKARKTF